MRRYRAAVLSAVVALTASVLQVPAAVTAPRARAEEPPAEVVTEAQASALAQRTGKPVTVASMQNETRDVVANNDGTFTLTQHLRPVRTRKNGAWVGIDTTLRRQPDGDIAPVATAAGLTFSGGGDGPMVTMSRAGRKLSLSWPGGLPEPALSADTATFGDVLPGVDLVLRAEVDGFAHLLKVKTSEAARNPKLAKLAFKLGTSGLSVQADAAGRLQANDLGAGGTVFEAPAALMWDSGHPTDDEVTKAGQPSVGGQDPVDAPGEGAKTAPLKVGVADGELTLEPDQALLTAVDTTFPVYVDPQWTAGSPAARLMVSSGGWERYNFTGDEGVGRCEVSKDPNCASNHTKRIFFRMPLSGVSGKYVESVEFTAFETHAYNCGNDTSIQLWHTSGFASTSTWSSTSDNWLTHLTSRDVSYCSWAPVEFGGSNLASVVRAAANRKDSAITFGLRAYSESTMDWWKRFDNDAFLKVQYNRPPNQPDTKKMYANPGTPCVDSPDAGWVNDEPTLNATLVDPDTEDAAKVQGQFQVSWDDGTGWGPKWTAALTAAKTSGSRFSLKIPDGVLPRNELMDWHVRAWDGIQWGPWSWAGAATGCYFYFDSTVPAQPAVTSADYPADGTWYDGVGKPGVFTMDDPTNAAARYEVRLNSVPVGTVPTTNGAPAQVTLTPTRAGPNLLTVQSFTNAGTSSAPTTYAFDVKTGAPPVAHWKLDESAGATAVSDEIAALPAGVAGGVTLGVDGQVGAAAGFNGSTGYLSTDGPVIDTSKSFSVSAWAKLSPTAETKNVAVLSQEGNRMSGFSLKYYPGTKKWQLLRYVADDDGAANKAATAATPVDLDTWTHLVGVFDASAEKLRIYVNGFPGTEGDFTTPWNAGGKFQIGRSKSSGGQGSYFDGDIDDVRVFDRVVTAEEATELYNQRPVLKGRWKLNTDGADDSGNGHALALGGNALVDPAAGFAGVSAGGLLLNSGGYAGTSAPVVDTAQSFTIAGWAQAASRPTGASTVFSQAGANTNRFALRYVPGVNPEEQGGFRLDMAGTDSATAPHAIADHAGFTEGWWDHVAIVYEATTDTMSLYVNGVLEENETNVSQEGQVLGFTATNGGLQVGRSMLGPAEFWPGAIDDVWAYQGALSAEQIGSLALYQELDTEFGP